MLLAVPSLWAESAWECWLSPGGDDAGLGTKARPFASLERARDAVREARGNGAPRAAIVHLLPGIYPRASSFELTSKDGGSVSAPVSYRAEGAAVLRAGLVVPGAAFRPLSNPAMAARLDPAARGKVLELDLAKLGVRHAQRFADHFTGGGGLLELHWNAKRLPLSRWPNNANATMGQVLDRGESAGKSSRPGVFVAREDRVARWRVADGVWLEGYWRVPWSPSAVRIASIDTATRTVTMAVPIGGGIGSKYAKAPALGDGKEPWWALNLLEEIDQPGEWCVDFRSQKLYVWAPSPVAEAAIAIADLDQPLVVLRGTESVTIEGIIFEQGLGNGLEIFGGAGNLVVGCEFRFLGGNGVVVRGGFRNGVRSSDFHGLGEAGILLSGGDRATLTACANFADNNHLHHLGIRKKTYAAGIHVGAFGVGPAVGCRVTHNLIHDLPHAGVLYSGNDNLFEFNEVSRVVLSSADMGAFYTTNDWTSQGNILRYNFVHSSPHANAFYMDDGDSGDLIVANVCHGMSYGPFIGGGHDNTVLNNLVIACARGLHLDARGLSRGYDKDSGLLRGLNAVPYKQSPWSERFPNLPSVLDRHPEQPSGNRIASNAVIGCGQPFHFAKPKELGDSKLEGNVAFKLEQAGFVDPGRADFTLRPDSLIFTMIRGFPVIPFAEIGLRKDAYRLTLPPREFGVSVSGDRPVFDSEDDVQRSNIGK